jgi:hypothetical protein
MDEQKTKCILDGRMKDMKYKLLRYIDGQWCYWGTYDVTEESELNAMVSAICDFAKAGRDVKTVRDE